MTIHLPQGDLARTISHEPSDEWPMSIQIVAYWPDKNGGKGRRRSIEISADEFFGRGEYGAPMGGDQLIAMIQALRKQGKPKK